ncbi:MAG: VTT domain-containing protein [Rhodospirillaceae bacterium]|jgi:uncharacterized membrane protein YdjX (TVP38/TMEM64 family)
MSWRVLLRGLVLIVTLVAIGILARNTGIIDGVDKNWIDQTVRGQGLSGIIIFLAVGAAFTGAGLPRQLIAALGGYAFGVALGTIYATLATVIGCAGAVLYARFMGRRIVRNKFPDRVKKIDDFLRDNPFKMTLIIRLLPVGSNLATNLAAGVTSVPFFWYLLGSAIGYIPQSLIFALVGKGVRIDGTWQITASVILFIISGILGAQLFHKYHRNRALDDEIERELQGEADDAPQ